MMKDDLIKALDPIAFSVSIGITPDPWQAEVLRYEGRRLLLNCCRQSGKSTTTATKALHKAIYTPKSLILLISPSLRQSKELLIKVKDGYNAIHDPPKLLEDNALSITLANNSRIISLPGDQGTVRGYSGVSLILMDEASQVEDDLYKAILPMLMVSDGQLILMSTPFGKRGFFYEEWIGENEWQRVKITGADCPRMDAEKLEKQKKSMGDMFFRQEYRCEFLDNTLQTFQSGLVEAAMDDSIMPLF